jgi:hypothetical protein
MRLLFIAEHWTSLYHSEVKTGFLFCMFEFRRFLWWARKNGLIHGFQHYSFQVSSFGEGKCVGVIRRMRKFMQNMH